MTKLALKNIGPVQNGLGEGKFFSFDGVTIFTGTQGSGKSTVAKLYSSLTWLEKAIQRGELESTTELDYQFFIDEVISYHGIADYFSKKSQFEYIGQSYSFYLSDRNFRAEKNEGADYLSPQIMYVPAERNFLAAIDRPELISKLPRSLKDFLSEYVAAKEKLVESREPLKLNEAYFEYQNDSKESFISGQDYKINLLQASSGFQSYVPMVLVTRYLSKVLTDSGSNSARSLNVEQERRLLQEIDLLINELRTSQSVNDRKKNDIQRLVQQVARRYISGRLINIVEEPEQNLYPTSQKQALFELLAANNAQAQNRLVITTHSPFITNYLNLTLKAHELYAKGLSADQQSELSTICPVNAAIPIEKTEVYEFQGNGTVTNLEKGYGFISDDNQLNMELGVLNELFAELVDIEG